MFWVPCRRHTTYFVKIDLIGSFFCGVCIIAAKQFVNAVCVDIAKNFNDKQIVAINILNSSPLSRIIACYSSALSGLTASDFERLKYLTTFLVNLITVNSLVALLGDFTLPPLLDQVFPFHCYQTILKMNYSISSDATLSTNL